MIVSKPKTTALTALSIFIIICSAIGGYALNIIINGAGAWYHYFVMAITFSIGFVLLIRQVVSYKVIGIGDKVVKVNYSFRFKSNVFKLKDLVSWKETIIQTRNAPFKQLELKFEAFNLKLSVQENTNYDQIYKYLKKRVGKKEVKN